MLYIITFTYIFKVRDFDIHFQRHEIWKVDVTIRAVARTY